MGFSKKKAMKGADTAASGLEDQAKARTAAFRSSADDDMSSVRKSMSDNTSSRVAASAPKKQSFAEAFRAARKEKGAGSTFSWNGKSYSTNLAGEGSSGLKPKATQSASRSGTGSSSAKPAAPATKSNLEDIRAKGAALRASFSGPARKPAAAPSDAGQTGNAFGRSRTPDQEAKLAAARARASSYWAQGKANIAKNQSMTEADKVRARMRELGTPGYAKGGSIDGAAIRGKTRMKRTK